VAHQPATVELASESWSASGLECYLDRVKALRAHVLNGQIVLDDPIELPEGMTVEVVLDPDELAAKERAEIEAAVDEGAEDFERGDFEDARAFALRLAATT
jgi:hypothetical protein